MSEKNAINYLTAQKLRSLETGSGILIAELEKIAVWLDRLASDCEASEKNCRFITLREAYASDAKNYRATIAHIRAAITKATLPSTGK